MSQTWIYMNGNAICNLLRIVNETLDKEGLKVDFGMARKSMYFDP